MGVDENLWASLQARSYCSFVLPSWKTLTKSKEETGLYIVVPQHDLYSGESQRLPLPTYRSNLRPVEEGGRWGPDVFRLVRDLVALKVAPIHPLLRRSCALGYTRRWWSILAVGVRTAAVDYILNQDSPIPVPNGAPPLADIFHWADSLPSRLGLLDQGPPWKRGQQRNEAAILPFSIRGNCIILFVVSSFPLVFFLIASSTRTQNKNEKYRC